MVDLDGDGVDDSMPQWFITALYASALIVLITMVGVFLGKGAYLWIVEGDPTVFPRDLAVAVVGAFMGLAAVDRMRKK